MTVGARKIATIERCIERARAELAQAGSGFKQDYTRQDAAILNVTRACEAAIDIANILVRKGRLGVPGDAKESFALLERAGLVTPVASARLQRMIGFRNIAVHQYQDLDLDIVEQVIRFSLDDISLFVDAVRSRLADT